jgi:hypothetical protein
MSESRPIKKPWRESSHAVLGGDLGDGNEWTSSEHFHDSILIIQLDQAGCHRAKRLQIPGNIILMFQPSHAPETNPIERVWLHLKQGPRWQLPNTLKQLQALVTQRLTQMAKKVIASLTGRASILEALSVAKL